MMQRLSPDSLWIHVHQDVIHWLNEVMIDVKTFLAAGHTPLIRPYVLTTWQAALRDRLDCKDWHRPAMPGGELYPLHAEAIDAIDALVEDLLALWEKRTPKQAITEERIARIDRLYGNIEQCRENPRKY